MKKEEVSMSMQRRISESVWRGWGEFFSKTRSLTHRAIGVSLLAVVAFLLIALLSRTTDIYLPSVTLVAAVLMSLYGGIGLGLVSTLLLGLVIDYLFIPPIGQVLASSEDQKAYFLITVVAVLTGTLVSSLRMAFLRSELAKQEAEQAKKEAEQAVRARDEIIGVISHELKNPLTALQTGVILTERILPKSPQNENALKLIEKFQPSIKRMELLVSDLLDVTRLEARALKLEPHDANLLEIVKEVVRSFGAAATAKLINLDILDIPTDAREVFCDPARTSQVLSNLVNNSIKFTGQGGSILISAKKLGDSVEVRVTDTGKGISREHLAHVFDRFWQAKETAYKGTGLGLSIAKGLVETQGGKIWVESREGEQSTFFFTLPAAKAPIRKTA